MDPPSERMDRMPVPGLPDDEGTPTPLTLPLLPQLPSDRAPTWDELRAAAAHYAITAHVTDYRQSSAHEPPRSGELCASLLEWIAETDEQRHGLAFAEIVSGFGDGRFGTPDGVGENLLERALGQLTNLREPLLELADGERWRVSETSPIEGMDRNAGYLLKAALVEGWDVIVPDTGYDGDTGSPPVDELIIMAGPGGRLKQPLHLSSRGVSELDEPILAFTFIFDPVDEVATMPRANTMLEVFFDCDYEGWQPYTGFVTFPVVPESGWGPGPDFREATHGWASWSVWGENELVVAWARPGDTERGCWKGSFEVGEDWPTDQHFWLALARAMVRAEAG